MTITNRILKVCWITTLIGLMVAAWAVLLAFEEPVESLLMTAAVLVLAGPTAIAVHLMLTRELTTPQKRSWLRQFVSWRAGAAVGAYIASPDRVRALSELLEDRHAHEP